MARLNVYVPEELAERARAANMNVSALVQSVLADELDRQATDAWLDGLGTRRGSGSHEAGLAALEAARDEFGE